MGCPAAPLSFGIQVGFQIETKIDSNIEWIDEAFQDRLRSRIGLCFGRKVEASWNVFLKDFDKFWEEDLQKKLGIFVLQMIYFNFIDSDLKVVYNQNSVQRLPKNEFILGRYVSSALYRF